MTGPCPSCGATVRPTDSWCTLCFADLRPPPPPAPVPAPVAPVPVRAAAPAVDPFTAPLDLLPPPPPPAPAPVDPLTAPLNAVLSQPLAADLGAPAPTWPCVECGERSPLDANACVVCLTPFGGKITRLEDAKALRQRRMFVGIGAVVAFLALLAMFTMATTKSPPPQDSGPVVTVTELPQ